MGRTAPHALDDVLAIDLRGIKRYDPVAFGACVFRDKNAYRRFVREQCDYYDTLTDEPARAQQRTMLLRLRAEGAYAPFVPPPTTEPLARLLTVERIVEIGPRRYVKLGK